MLVGSKVSWLSSTPLAPSPSQCRISKEPATEKPLIVFVLGTRRHREGKRRGVKVKFPREKVRRSGCVHWRHGLGLGLSGTKPGAHHPLGFPLLFQQGVHGPAQRQMLISECRAEP